MLSKEAKMEKTNFEKTPRLSIVTEISGRVVEKRNALGLLCTRYCRETTGTSR
jgi:hypothetical protein